MGGLIPAVSAVDADLFVTVNLALVTGLYLWAARRTGFWPAGRTIAFLSATAILGLAYIGPFGAWAHDVFWAHMSQHILVMMIAAPLIVLSSPVRLTFLSLGPNGRRAMVRLLRSSAVYWLTRPAVGWSFFAFVLLFGHTTWVMNWALISHDGMVFVIRPLYLAAALIFYYPMIGSDLISDRPAPSARLVWMALMMVPETALGMIVHFAPVPLYWPYQMSADVYGYSALADQKLAGAMMWAFAMIFEGVWLMVAALEWWKDQERQTERLERIERRDRLAHEPTQAPNQTIARST